MNSLHRCMDICGTVGCIRVQFYALLVANDTKVGWRDWKGGLNVEDDDDFHGLSGTKYNQDITKKYKIKKTNS